MTEKIIEFFASLPKELYIFVISLLPIVELRGAIPVGAAIGLPFYANYIISVVGNILPVPFILLFIPKILDFLAKFKLFRPMVLWLRKKADKHSSKVLGEDSAEANPSESLLIEEKTVEDAVENGQATVINSSTQIRKMTKGIFIALFLFVAIPLPGTGAWTGSLVASLFNLPKRWSILAVFLGVLLSGVIMTLASYGAVGFLSFLTK